MNWKDFYDKSRNSIAFSDGSMGVFLQKYGLAGGECPEIWNITHGEIVASVHQSYIDAGSELIITNTLGGNRVKLSEFNLGDSVKEINDSAVKIARRAAGDRAIVAGDVGPTGKFVRPLGPITFDEMKDIYSEQIEVLANAGADCIFFETHIDILELKAAIIACKEVCDLPIIASVTFEGDGRTVTGSTPGAAFTMIEALGADMAGTNCGTGPVDMINIIDEARGLISIPIIAQANAGVPFLSNGRTVFKGSIESYTDAAVKMIEKGANAVGGCCGTTPDHIKRIRDVIGDMASINRKEIKVDFMKLSSRYIARKIGFEEPFTIIGERLNPTARKKLSEDIKTGKFEIFRDEALSQEEAGAHVLDLNMGIEGISEAAYFEKGIEILGNLVKTPLSIDTANAQAAELSLKLYPGKPILNSISAERKRLDLLKTVKKYGAAFIALPIDEKGIPKTAGERIKLMRKITDEALKLGIDKKDILADPLVLTVSAEQGGAAETLKTIRMYRDELGLFSALGLSNISFGLPARNYINRNFLSMAVGSGLTAAIANPLDEELMGLVRASDVLLSRDPNAAAYIGYYSQYENSNKTVKAEAPGTVPGSRTKDQLYESILKGNVNNIGGLIKEALEQKMDPAGILNEHLIPAVAQAGNLYEKRIYFLPQLMLSAEAMKTAFSILEPLLKTGEINIKGKIVIATVKGDVHDIGKNIVILLLKNYGFDIMDLGKDVPNEVILEKAEEFRADIIALSSLMTTTMQMMKEFMDLLKEKNRKYEVLVGGAAVTREFAESIGAHYSVDAVSAVKSAMKIMGL